MFLLSYVLQQNVLLLPQQPTRYHVYIAQSQKRRDLSPIQTSESNKYDLDPTMPSLRPQQDRVF